MTSLTLWTSSGNGENKKQDSTTPDENADLPDTNEPESNAKLLLDFSDGSSLLRTEVEGSVDKPEYDDIWDADS